MGNEEKFWKVRSEKYNNLNWVNEPTYIDKIISVGDFKKTDLILDVGTGTGVVAHALAPIVGQVIGIDLSQDMMNNTNWEGNKYFIKRDIRNPFFNENTFDKITARMVFHHILENTDEAMSECFRVLKKKGKMILSEGVPPTKAVKEDYIRIFKLKEDRLTFLEDDLVNMMTKAGFRNIEIHEHIMKDFSIKNWLENSGLPQKTQDLIFEMHVRGSDEFRKAYNMRITNGDCLINTRSVIIVGEK